ncbi:MAG: OmpA family protein [Crocinitomix sp.]|nr:OmpA family protein [Crocinitomix sp.]
MKSRFFFILVMLYLSVNLTAQNTEKKLEEAQEEFEGFGYDQAIEKFESISLSEIADKRKLAISYWRTNRLNEAEDIFSDIVKSEGHVSEDIYSYAAILRENRKYDVSEKWMKIFIEVNPTDSRGQDFLENLADFGKIVEDRGKQKIVRLAMNSEEQDFGGAYYMGKLVFSSSGEHSKAILRKWNGNGKGFLKVCAASIQPNGELGDVEEFEARFSRKYHDGPVAFNAAGDLMIITRNTDQANTKKGQRKLQLVASKKVGDKWQKPIPLPFNSSDYSCGLASISGDNEWLYFVSNMPGGFGGTDIYRASISEDGTFGTPENLGAKINTEGNEMFPFFHAKDHILFYSSDGKLGLGGLDVFVAEVRDDLSIGRVFNPGKPINSNRDDFGLVLDADQKRGYLSSNRYGTGVDDDDLIGVEIIEPFLFGRIVQGTVIDQDGEPADSVVVSLLDGFSGEQKQYITDSTGRYRFDNDRVNSFSITAEKNGYVKAEIISSSEKRSVLDVRDMVVRKHTKISFKLVIKESRTGYPVSEVIVKLINNSDSLVTFGETSRFGECIITLNNETALNTVGDFDLKIRKDGYLTKVISFKMLFEREGLYNLNEYLKRELDQVVKMEKVNVGLDLNEVMEIKPIYFDFATSKIRDDAKKELDKIVKVMNENENIRIDLRAHTDSRGTSTVNMKLSRQRASVSELYIKSRISNPERVTSKGFGESELVNKCKDGVSCSEEDHQQNRRTEFIILEL